MLFYGMAAGVVAVDFITKIIVKLLMVEGQTISIIPGYISITYVFNTGMAYSLMSGEGKLITGFAIVVLIFMIAYYESGKGKINPYEVAGMGLMMGGGFGNVLSRLLWGGVVDFLDVKLFPVMNLADILLCFGAFLVLMVSMDFFETKEQKEAKAAAKAKAKAKYSSSKHGFEETNPQRVAYMKAMEEAKEEERREKAKRERGPQISFEDLSSDLEDLPVFDYDEDDAFGEESWEDDSEDASEDFGEE